MQSSKLNRRLKLFSLFFLSQCSLLVFFTKLVTAKPVVLEEIAQQSSTSENATRAAAQRVFEEANKLYRQGTAESLRQAIVKFEEALVLWRKLKDKKLQATTLNNIGLVYRDLGEKQKALEFINQALPLFGAVGDRVGEATTLNNIGAVYRDLGENQKAFEFYNQALPLLRAVGDKGREAITLNNIGEVYRDLGEKQKALEFIN
ncbi:MAG: tetratricopeptide repeat protein, partial [Rivularia sp. (in: cyanobacteria)]